MKGRFISLSLIMMAKNTKKKTIKATINVGCILVSIIVFYTPKKPKKVTINGHNP